MEEVPDYPVRVFFTREGYFKKITPQSLRMSGEQKLKEGDAITQEMDTTNAAELMFFTNLGQVYKSRVAEFEDTKASVMGDYVASKLGMDTGEVPVYMALFTKYEGYMLFIFENGKAAKVDMASYETKTRRKKLTGAFSTKSPLVYATYLPQDTELLLRSSASRMLIFHTAMILSKAARDTQGVQVMTLSKKGARVVEAAPYQPGMVPNDHRLRSKNLPATGGIVRDLEVGNSSSFDFLNSCRERARSRGSPHPGFMQPAAAAPQAPPSGRAWPGSARPTAPAAPPCGAHPAGCIKSRPGGPYYRREIPGGRLRGRAFPTRPVGNKAPRCFFSSGSCFCPKKACISPRFVVSFCSRMMPCTGQGVIIGGKKMSTLAIIGAVAMIVISILIIVVVSLQEGKGDGITALAGVSAFLNDSNDRSANAKLSKLTKILAIIFVVITLLVYILQ